MGSVSRFFAVALGFRVGIRSAVTACGTMAGMLLVKLFGSIRPIKLVALARDPGNRDSQDQQWEKFHRRAS